MSVKIMGAVWDADLPRDEKYILLAYADHAAHDGTSIFPSIGLVAWKTGYSERSVQSITRELQRKGFLVYSGKHQKYQTNIWKIPIENLPQRLPYNNRGANFALGGCRKQQGGVQKTAGGGAEFAPDPSLTITEPSNNHNHDFSEDLEFPSTDNPLSISNMPSEPSGRRDKIPRKDYLEALSEFAEKQSTDRPKGWQDVREAVFEICQHVARLWFAGRLPTGTWGDRIEKWCAGAAELLRYHDDNLQMTCATLDRYHAHYVENEMTLSLAGPHSLINVISQFMAQNGAGNSPQKVLRIGR